MRRADANFAKGGLELVEEGIHLLRNTSGNAFAVYYAGAVPFIAGLLYFLSDMSRSPFAAQHLAEAALSMAALFIWFKFSQAVFAAHLGAALAAESGPRWTWRQKLHVFALQAVVQPSSLFVVPLAMVTAVPFGWVCAFYESVTAIGGVDCKSPGRLIKRAARESLRWPAQNHIGLAVLTGFALCVFVDCGVVVVALPSVVKVLSGFETVFSRSPDSMLNSTFVETIAALTFLCVDPIWKAFYTLRRFYGESLDSGEDLRAALKREMHVAVGAAALREASPRRSAAILSCIVCLMVWGHAGMAQAQTQTQTQTQTNTQNPVAVSAAEFDRKIDDVLQQPRYTWRMPHEAIAEPESQKGIIGRFVDACMRMLKSGLRALSRELDRFFRDLLGRDASSGRRGRVGSASLWTLALLSLVVATLVILLLRGRRPKAAGVTPAAVLQSALPDLSRDDLAADQLPADTWSGIARDLLARGELRLAMRALHLSTLSHLGRHDFIRIARYKTNRDYENELARRAHTRPDLLPVFRTNVLLFEGIWYGSHGVDPGTVQQFAAGADWIRSVS
jgi:hypothetical protein